MDVVMNDVDNIARLLLFSSQLYKRSIITKNGYIILKQLILKKDERLNSLFNVTNNVRRNDDNQIIEYHILEIVNELIIDETERIHASLFSTCPLAHAKSLSMCERDTLGLHSNTNLIYGEISFHAFAKVLLKITSVSSSSSPPSPLPPLTFYDLGSGTGKAVIAAKLLYPNFNICSGIEILENLIEVSNKIKNKLLFPKQGDEQLLKKLSNQFNKNNKENKDVENENVGNENENDIEFIKDDFLNLDTWYKADILFINSTCYNENVMDILSKKIELYLKYNSYIITFTKPLNLNKKSNIEILEKSRYAMSWGMATVYIHRKIDKSISNKKTNNNNNNNNNISTINSSDSRDSSNVSNGSNTADENNDGNGLFFVRDVILLSNKMNGDSDSDDTEDDSEVLYEDEFLVEEKKAAAAEIAEQIEARDVSYEGMLYKELFSRWDDDLGRQTSDGDVVRQSQKKNGTLTYGEVTYAPFVVSILDRIRVHGGMNENSKVFTDVGCGTAKPVFISALNHGFKLCRGIELLSDLYSCALNITSVYENEIQIQFNKKDQRRYTKFEMICSDAFDENCHWEDSDIVFANSTCFNNAMFAKFELKTKLLKKGSFIVTTTSSLKNKTLFELLESGQLHEDWGTASLYIHRRL